MDKIVAFDVETPNCQNNKICAIGLSIIENGEIVYSQDYLVNPECNFDTRNIQIHGIQPRDVRDAPSFPQIWEKISTLFRSNLVAAHNASFDLCVLRKTLQAYQISESILYYVDTMTIAQSAIPEAKNYRLPTLCDWFGLPLNNHNAGSDSDACAKLLCIFLKSGAKLDSYITSYDLSVVNTPAVTCKPHRISATNQSLLTLNNILSSITCDGVLVETEVEYLQKWMDDNKELQGNYPYDKIYATLSAALADGVLEKSELESMLQLFKHVANPVQESSCDCQKLRISGKNICLSGEFDIGSKADVSENLIAHGACIQNSVTQKTDILLVGGHGSSALCAGNYGTKVKKALQMQEKGSKILLVREADLFASLED